MIPTPKFAIGATVYYPRVEHDKVHKTCPDCLGRRTWHAVLPSSEELDFSCPTCTHGYECTGKVSSWDAVGRVETLTIGSVRLDSADEHPIQYMCVETGVGSGRLYNEENLLTSLEEAEALLPKMVEEYRAGLIERWAQDRKRKIKDGPGRMAAYYRAKIRDAEEDIRKAERGLAREASKP